MTALKVNAYKCPHCNLLSLDKDKINEHTATCCKNPSYTQKCINCVSLHEHFTTKQLYGNGICLHTGRYANGCPYVHHDSTEVDKEIAKSRDAYIKFTNYDSSISPQENWKREVKYDELRKRGESPEKSVAIVY